MQRSLMQLMLAGALLAFEASSINLHTYTLKIMFIMIHLFFSCSALYLRNSHASPSVIFDALLTTYELVGSQFYCLAL